jgi:hypothetical protein
MKFLVLAAVLSCVAAEADPALFYGSGLYGGVYGGVYGSALGYAGYPAYGYRVAAPVVRTVAAPVTTTYTRSYTLPSVYSGYHGLTGYHGLGYAGLYGYGLPIVKTEAAAEAETGVEEARKKREAEADPALFYSSFASPAYGYSYGLHSGYVAPRVYSGYHGLGYAGYHGLGYAGYHGLGYAGLGYGYHGLGYAGYPYGYVVKPAEKAADEAVEEA